MKPERGLGGSYFLVKFKGACLRPPIPRPITKNQAMQVKFVDDATQMASVNLKNSLMSDPVSRPKPLSVHERTEMVLIPEEIVLQAEFQKFH